MMKTIKSITIKIAAISGMYGMIYSRAHCTNDSRVHNTTDSRVHYTTDSRVFRRESSLCRCRDNSPYLSFSPYVSSVDGSNISNFAPGMCVKKVSGFARIISDSGDVAFVKDSLHVGKKFIIKSITFETFKCDRCMSRQPKRDVITYVLVGSDGEELILKQSEFDQNPYCGGWSKI